jgi:hypothetical protein
MAGWPDVFNSGPSIPQMLQEQLASNLYNPQSSTFMPFPGQQSPQGMPGSRPMPFNPAAAPPPSNVNVGTPQPAGPIAYPGTPQNFPVFPPGRQPTSQLPWASAPLPGVTPQNSNVPPPLPGMPSQTPPGINWGPNTGGINGMLRSLNTRQANPVTGQNELSPLQQMLLIFGMYGLGSLMSGSQNRGLPMVTGSTHPGTPFSFPVIR